MKNKITIVFILYCFLITVNSPLVAQNPAATFDKIKIINSSEVVFVQNSEFKIVIDGKDTKSKKKIYRIKNNGWLEIDGPGTSNITVYAPTLKNVSITGTGEFYTNDTLLSESFTVEVSGVGKIDINVIVKKLNVFISGAGKIIVSGECDELHTEISGAGKLMAGELEVQRAEIDISGAGKAVVDVKEELNANISGSGEISYISTPKIINRKITGDGNITEDNLDDSDTTRIVIGETKILIIDDVEFKIKRNNKKVKGHWRGFELGINMLMDDKFTTDVPEGYEFLELNRNKSVAVHLNLIDHKVHLKGRYIMFITGLGFTWNNYRFRSDQYLDPESSQVQPAPDSLSYSKNKLVVCYLNAPLLFEFNTSEYKKQTIHFAAGVIIGLRVGSYIKLVRNNDGNKYKKKIFDSFNLNPMKYDATVRFGFKNFTVFGNYSLGNFFKSSKEPELHPLTIGVRLLGW
jgi:putative autotransporter adhesin-like protein